MLYYVIRRPLHKNTNFSNRSTANYQTGLVMPRYHYSRIAPHSATTSSESFFLRQNSNGQTSIPSTNNSHYPSALFKSTFIPFVTNTRITTPHKREEVIPISITTDNGISMTNNSIHSIPVTFVSETTQLSAIPNNNSSSTSSKPLYANLLRPGSKRFQRHHINQNIEESRTTPARLPSVSRRSNLAIPIMTTTNDNDVDKIKQNISSSSVRQVPIRLSHASNVASIPTKSSRISSAILRSTPLPNSFNNPLQRQRSDLLDTSSSDLTATPPNVSSVYRTEMMGREAMQGIARFQQQNFMIPDNTNISIRSPPISRRVIVNLKNNQSVSLDSRLWSANVSSMKPSSQITQQNNAYHIPILNEIQVPSQTASETSQSPSICNANNNSYKNEFHMELPISTITKDNQENHVQSNDGKINYDQSMTIDAAYISPLNTNSSQKLKSILKRSSSRETISRKNVSFMNV